MSAASDRWVLHYKHTQWGEVYRLAIKGVNASIHRRALGREGNIVQRPIVEGDVVVFTGRVGNNDVDAREMFVRGQPYASTFEEAKTAVEAMVVGMAERILKELK